MCGVIGLVFERSRADLGLVAAELLKQLEYRGYDSTGAAAQGDGPAIVLKKGVGAPSAVVGPLGIVGLTGRTLVGQVRWATFGAVDESNAQPHQMHCKTALFGAHNGNVTNCDDLKRWLLEQGHAVRSDNDGEMLVHTVEHEFAVELARLADPLAAPARRAAMRRALATAGAKLRGSYAAVVADPVSRALWAIKNGSSLYFGIGADDVGGGFGIASSDLSAVLRLTRLLVPLAEGEYVEFDAAGHQVYRLMTGEPLSRPQVRSRLRAKDTGLRPPFETFMDQEIHAQEKTCRDVVAAVNGGSEQQRAVAAVLDGMPEHDRALVHAALGELRGQSQDDAIRGAFQAVVSTTAFATLLERAQDHLRAASRPVGERLVSAEGGFLGDLLAMARDERDELAILVMDALFEHEEVEEFELAIERFCRLCHEVVETRGRLYVLCCGSSYHAARAAALFFDEIAQVEVVPSRPGDFRGQHLHSLRDGDLVIAVSQSGETKDLIDALNDVRVSGRQVHRVGLVNNVNSTLAQEKSDLVIPLRCGPEIAVPATKSFMNQLVLFYCLAVRLAEFRAVALPTAFDPAWRDHLAVCRRRLSRLPGLIREAIDTTATWVERAAQDLFLAPSMHILATRITAVAEEGALKVREVVLNHTEGYEASEFKHGPNTILGVNTLYGPREVDGLLAAIGLVVESAVRRGAARGADGGTLARLARGAAEVALRPEAVRQYLSLAEEGELGEVIDRQQLLCELVSDYPLVFVTGPGERDIQLTVSQINTHKIRGARLVVIAEENRDLRQAAEKPPANNPDYRAVFIPLPATGDTLLTVFSATVVLQRLALRMSLLKKDYLDGLGVLEHGVHPDVPKNVSKSITVD